MDGEAMTADGPGGCYWGPVTFAKDASTALAGPPRQGIAEDLANCSAGGMLVVSGRGAGAFALIRSIEGRSVVLDRPMPIASDADTVATIIPIHTRYLLIDNEGTDTGTFLQVFGGSVDHVFANNRSFRSGGYSIWAGEYLGYPQVNFYAQLIGNQAKSGYLSGLFQYVGATSLVRVFNDAPPKYDFPMVRGVAIRDSKLQGNASISVENRVPRARPSRIVDVVIEGNHIEKSDTGIEVGVGTADIYTTNNFFEDVTRPVIDKSRKTLP